MSPGAGSISLRRLLIGSLVIAAAWALAVWVGRAFIAAVYRGDLLPDLLQHRATEPLEHYFSVMDRILFAVFLLIGLCVAVLYALRFRSAMLVLGILLVGDIIFCVLSERYGGLLNIRRDGAIPEWFQYFKEVGIAVMLFRLFFWTRERILVGWACLFTFLFLDDALKYHERMGRLLAAAPGVTALANGLEVRPVDIGEMVSLIPVLVALVVFVARPYLRASVDERRMVHRFGALLLCLILVGGVLDLIDRMAMTRGSDRVLVGLLTLLEDGGEMVVMSAMFTYAVTLWWRHSPAPSSITPMARQATSESVN